MTPRNAQLELERLYRLADDVRRTVPFGEIGREPYRPSRRIAPDPSPEPLMLASGLLDDERPLLPHGDLLYGVFAYAKQWQDTWTGRAHESFWRWTLDAWPGKKGKPSNTYALAYALVVAIKAHVDLDTFLERLSAELRTKAITGQTAERYTLASLQRRDAVRIATEMIMTPQHLHPATGRLPRVLTEHDRLPHPPVDIAALDRYSKRGDASREIVAAAGRVAAELPPIGPAFNPEDRRRR